MGGVVLADPARAVTAGILQPGVAVSGVTGYGEVWLGAMQAPAGYGDDFVFCITAGGDDPAARVVHAARPGGQLQGLSVLHG